MPTGWHSSTRPPAHSPAKAAGLDDLLGSQVGAELRMVCKHEAPLAVALPLGGVKGRRQAQHAIGGRGVGRQRLALLRGRGQGWGRGCGGMGDMEGRQAGRPPASPAVRAACGGQTALATHLGSGRSSLDLGHRGNGIVHFRPLAASAAGRRGGSCCRGFRRACLLLRRRFPAKVKSYGRLSRPS